MHRVQGIDDEDGARDGHASVERAAAEAVEQHGLALPRKTGFSQPRAKLGKTCGIHARLPAAAR
jgi:hypothetical protein